MCWRDVPNCPAKPRLLDDTCLSREVQEHLPTDVQEKTFTTCGTLHERIRIPRTRSRIPAIPDFGRKEYLCKEEGVGEIMLPDNLPLDRGVHFRAIGLQTKGRDFGIRKASASWNRSPKSKPLPLPGRSGKWNSRRGILSLGLGFELWFSGLHLGGMKDRASFKRGLWRVTTKVILYQGLSKSHRLQPMLLFATKVLWRNLPVGWECCSVSV